MGLTIRVTGYVPETDPDTGEEYDQEVDVEKELRCGGGASLLAHGRYLVMAEIVGIDETNRRVHLSVDGKLGWVSVDHVKDCLDPSAYAIYDGQARMSKAHFEYFLDKTDGQVTPD